MTITLTDGTTPIALPDDLLWVDQHAWSPVEQAVATSITGAAIMDVATRINGRPITLQAGDSFAWLYYSVVAQLKAWAAMPGKELTLSLRGTSFTVVFRHHDKPAIDVQPVVDFNAINAEDYFFGTLKFMEV